jgi:hypothetical protein
LGDAQSLLGVTDVEEGHGQHGVGEYPTLGCELVVDRRPAVLEPNLDVAGERLHGPEHAQAS